MLNSLAQLLLHLYKVGRVWGYIKLLLWRHRHILAYLILAGGILYTVLDEQAQNNRFNQRIVQTGIEGRRASCSRDLALTNNIRAIIDGAQIVAKAQHKQKILSDDQYAQSTALRKNALKKLPRPRCDEYVQQYKEQIDKATP